MSTFVHAFKKMLSCLCLFLCCLSLRAENFEEIFLRANQAYHQKEFQRALSLYDVICPKSCIVYYNMGNCWYRLGNHFEALLCWRKAEHNAPYALRTSLEHNCAKALQHLGLPEEKENKFVQNFCRWLTSYSVGMLQFLFLLFWIILIAALCYTRLASKKIWLILLLAPNCVIGLSLSLRVWLQSQERGIIKEDQTFLCAGTNMNFSKRGVLKKGQEIAVLESKDEWCKVRNAQQSGWIKKNSLELIHC